MYNKFCFPRLSNIHYSCVFRNLKKKKRKKNISNSVRHLYITKRGFDFKNVYKEYPSN
jgi:hypothetical protein